MGMIGGVLLLSLLASADAPLWQAPPAALAGLWFADDQQGQEDCDSLKQARDPWQNEGSLLVGALWIDGERLHRMAEFGEGDIHQVVGSVEVSPTQWQLEVAMGMDVLPGLEQDGSFPLWLSLTDGLLVWQQTLWQPYTRTWERCSDLPPRPAES